MFRTLIHYAHKLSQILTECLDPDHVHSQDDEKCVLLNLNHTLKLGEAAEFQIGVSPDVTFSPHQLLCNVPCHGMIIISDILICQRGYEPLAVLIGGEEDAFNYTESMRVFLSIPEITPKDTIIINGRYTGLSPAPYQSGCDFNLTFSAIGPMREPS